MKIKVFYLTRKIGRFKSIALPVDGENIPKWFMDEFVDLSTVLGELSRKLGDNLDAQLQPFIVDILDTLILELNAWVITIFIDRTSNNIHELDASLIGSSKQLLMFL